MSILSELRDSVKELIESQREVAIEALIEIMTETYSAVGRMIVESEDKSGEKFVCSKSVAGLSAAQLTTLVEKTRSGDLLEWFRTMDSFELVTMASDFAYFEKLRREAFRQKFPSSFKKWSSEDDALLKDLYESGRHWDEISSFFGRNVNAVKLRLQKLGYDLGPETAYPRFHR